MRRRNDICPSQLQAVVKRPAAPLKPRTKESKLAAALTSVCQQQEQLGSRVRRAPLPFAAGPASRSPGEVLRVRSGTDKFPS